MTKRTSAEELSIDETIQEAAEILRDCERVLILGCDKDGKLRLIRSGIDEIELPGFMHKLSEMFAEAMAKEIVERVIASAPMHSKGKCPACQQSVVILSPENFEQFAARKHVVSVCACGAFLMPSITDDGGLCLREMSDAEVDALPAPVREHMIELRQRHLEQISAKQRAN